MHLSTEGLTKNGNCKTEASMNDDTHGDGEPDTAYLEWQDKLVLTGDNSCMYSCKCMDIACLFYSYLSIDTVPSSMLLYSVDAATYPEYSPNLRVRLRGASPVGR